MQLELLRQAQTIVSRCGGRRSTRPGMTVVPIERKILMPMVLQPNQAKIFTKEVVGETVWALRAISSDQGSNSITGVRVQIQLPNGRFLIGGNGQDIGQFAWVGSNRYSFDEEVECQPGSKIQVTLTDMVGLGAAFVCNLLFEGCYKYYIDGDGSAGHTPGASDDPRYQGIVNENILAPSYQAGYGPVTPAGYDDSLFTYSSDVATLPLAGPLYTTLKIPIDSGIDFQLRRILLDVQQDATVTAGVVLVRLRAGAGYALNDEYIDLARYVAGAEFAHDWKVRGQDAVFLDLQLADGAGVGSMTVVAHLEGVRRRKV
jgi:hypothetical protein